MEYEIRVNDQTVYTHSGFEAQISYMPQEFGVHTLTMTATDANGQQASATYSIPVAVEEREHASDWERTFANVKLTGNFAEDILAIARTQLGYSESERDFIIDEDDVQHGYTRYGAWYGASYSEWCAMFVSFCAHYAQIPEKYLPQAANCAKWKKNLDKLYLDDEDSYAPEAGDLIFFHYNRTEDQRPESEKEKNVPNHVGIVTGTDKNYIYTIEGNSAGRVRECRYEWGDEHIVGYVSMAEIMRLANPETATPAETKAPAEPEAPGETAAPTETVTPTETKAPFDGAAYVRIVGRSVNLRAEASVDSESLGHANQDDMFRVDGQVENEIGEIWYCVFYGESFAYVRSDLAEAHEATVGTDEQLPGIDENLPSVDEEFPRIDGNLPGADEEVPNAEHKFQRFDYNSEIPDGFTQTESGLLYNLEDEALEPEERVYLVYGRYGEGEARLYFCDQIGTPMGEEMYFVPAIVMAGGGQQDSMLTVSVKANKSKYTSADNIVSLTIKVKSKKNDSLPKGKNLRITLSGDLSELRYINASVEDNTDIEWAGSASGNVIYLKPSNNVGTGTVVIKCSYKIKEGTAHSVRTISVQAYDEAKKYEGSADASYEYAKAEGVCVSSVSVPTTVVAPGETVMGTVHLANYNDSEQIVTKLVVKDASGSVVCTQENLSVTVPGNSGSGEVAFSFVAPAGKYGNADYTVEVTYGEDSANTGNFTITLPADPKLSIANTVSVSYRTNDEAYFSAMRVKVTDNSSSADNKRNEKNAGSIQMRTANGDWTTVASIAQSSKINIKDGNFAFDLNGKVTPDEVLNNLFRVELTVANDKGLSTPYPQSEWFYLTDSLPKAGFREWVLNPENGYLNDGTFNGDMDALAEAYKKYSRLGLTVTSESVTGEAGQTATLPVRVKSDEAMTSNGVIEISLSDSTVEGKIVFDGCAGQSGFGNVSINAKGNLELALNQLLEAGTEAVVNVTVPLGYETAIGEHTVDIDAKYRGSSYGEVEKQAQGTGTIVVTAAMGWHILSVESPSGAVMPGGNVTYALKIRNFDTKSVELKAVQAALEGTALEIVGMRLADGTEISLDNPSIVLPAASGEGDAYVPGDVTLQLRVTAPGTAMSNKTVDFTALDAEGHPEPAKGTLTVVKPTLTIKPVVDYDPFTKAVTVKLVAENAGSPSGAYTWQNLDTRDAYADWETIATTGSNGELTLTGDHLTELEAFGADSAKLQYRLIDASGDTVYAMSNAAAFENLPQLMKAVEVVAELAEHYGYSYANFRRADRQSLLCRGGQGRRRTLQRRQFSDAVSAVLL